MSYTGRDLVLGGLFLALSLVVPILFHALGLGAAFLPMFFPILACGFVTALPVSVAVGLLAPLVSALLTGMPPFFPPTAFIMMVEGMVLAGVAGLLYRKLRMPMFVSLVAALAADRLVLLGGVMLAARWLRLPEGALGVASVVRGVPGIVLILLVVPPLVKRLEQRLNLMVRYE